MYTIHSGILRCYQMAKGYTIFGKPLKYGLLILIYHFSIVSSILIFCLSLWYGAPLPLAPYSTYSFSVLDWCIYSYIALLPVMLSLCVLVFAIFQFTFPSNSLQKALKKFSLNTLYALVAAFPLLYITWSILSHLPIYPSYYTSHLLLTYTIIFITLYFIIYIYLMLLTGFFGGLFKPNDIKQVMKMIFARRGLFWLRYTLLYAFTFLSVFLIASIMGFEFHQYYPFNHVFMQTLKWSSILSLPFSFMFLMLSVFFIKNTTKMP